MIARGQSMIDLAEVAPPGPEALHLVPIDNLRQAVRFIGLHHRHSKAPRGWRFGVGAARGRLLVGVAVVGRPVARELDKLRTVAEVTRCCVKDTPPPGPHASGAASMLYAACWRAARALGYRRVVTYTLPHESGVSLRAAGYVLVTDDAGGGSWSRGDRPRTDDASTITKLRWEIGDVVRAA